MGCSSTRWYGDRVRAGETTADVGGRDWRSVGCRPCLAWISCKFFFLKLIL